MKCAFAQQSRLMSRSVQSLKSFRARFGNLVAHFKRASRSLAALALTLLAVSSWSTNASAYAWMIQKGFAECGSCHVDPSGGELLTHMGRVQSEVSMSTYWHGDVPRVSEQSKLGFVLDEPDDLRLGGSLRYMGIYTLHSEEAKQAAEATGDPLDPLSHFPMQMDVYGVADLGRIQIGASVGVASVSPPHVQAAQVTSGQDRVLISRWHWLGIELSDDMLMRALHVRDDVLADVGEDGVISIEGHAVGRLSGVSFEAERGQSALEDRALRAAA